MAKKVADLVKEGRFVAITNPEINAGFKKAFQDGSAKLEEAVARRAGETEGLRKINRRFYIQPQYNPSRTSHFYSSSNLKDYSLLEPNISDILFL